MNNIDKTFKRVVKVGVYTAITLYVCPEVLGFQGGDENFGGAILAAEGDKLKTLVKPILGIGGLAGMVMGGLQAFKQSSLAPLLTWFGIGAGSLVGYGMLGSNLFSATVGM